MRDKPQVLFFAQFVKFDSPNKRSVYDKARVVFMGSTNGYPEQ